MADLSDVSYALGLLLEGVLYPVAPTGILQASPVVGAPVKIEVGWPSPQSLDQQKAQGTVVLSIYPRPTERNTTRYSRAVQQSGPLQPATFTLTAGELTVTVGGAQPSTYYPQNFAVFVNQKAYLYQALQTDNAAAIATALAALIVVDVPGTSASGDVITVPSPAIIGAVRVGTQAPTSQEVKRQEREWQIIVWAPTPALRDKVAAPIDVVIGQTPFLSFADGSSGRLLYKGSPFTDFDQKQGLFRRDLIVSVDYATIALGTAAEAIAIKTIFEQQAPDGSTITPPILTTYT